MNENTTLLLTQLIRSGKMTEAAVDGLLSGLNLSTTKMLTLRHLVETGEPVSLGSLANCMSFAKSNATQLADHLESEGLVRRGGDPGDRRCTLLGLTDKGKRRQEAAAASVHPLVEQIEELFTPEERTALGVLLKRLIDSLA